MTDEELREARIEFNKLAIKKVCALCRQQGVKIYPSDFKPIHLGNQTEVTTYKRYDTDLRNVTSFDGAGGQNLANRNTIKGEVVIYLYFSGRWGKKLKEKSEIFLNYINCRVRNDAVCFSFTYKELDIDRISNSAEDIDAKEMEKIIDKINKLLTLADTSRNPSEHEAISASMKVQKLLAKYNITMADVRGEAEVEEPIEQAISDVGCNDKAQNWRTELALAVANGYACKTYMVGTKNAIVFYGYKADILLARRVYTYLYNVGVKLGRQYVREHRNEWESEYRLYQSFVSGFTNGVRGQLEMNCTALALVCPEKVKEAYEVMAEDFRHSRIGQGRSNTIDANAYLEGEVEGKRALNAQYIE